MANNDPIKIPNLDAITNVVSTDYIIVAQASNGHVGKVTVNNFFNNTAVSFTVNTGVLTANQTLFEHLQANNALISNLNVTEGTINTFFSGNVVTTNVTALLGDFGNTTVNNSFLSHVYVQTRTTPATNADTVAANVVWFDNDFAYFAIGANAIRKVPFVPVPLVTTIDDTTYTYTLDDANGWRRFNNASAISVTVPNNFNIPYVIGTQLIGEQIGDGQVTFVADTDMTINTPTTLKLNAQFSVASIMKVDTDEWTIVGDLATS